MNPEWCAWLVLDCPPGLYTRSQVQFWQHRYVQAGLWFDPEHEFKSYQVGGDERCIRE